MCTSSLSFQTPPTADEAGYCDKVYVDEIGETAVIVFKQGNLVSQKIMFTCINIIRFILYIKINFIALH